jgi:hypothetical protein
MEGRSINPVIKPIAQSVVSRSCGRSDAARTRIACLRVLTFLVSAGSSVAVENRHRAVPGIRGARDAAGMGLTRSTGLGKRAEPSPWRSDVA